MSVKGTNTAVVLKKLQPGTEYDISVSARYRSGLGEPLEGRGTTEGGKFMYVALQLLFLVCSHPLIRPD